MLQLFYYNMIEDIFQGISLSSFGSQFLGLRFEKFVLALVLTYHKFLRSWVPGPTYELGPGCRVSSLGSRVLSLGSRVLGTRSLIRWVPGLGSWVPPKVPGVGFHFSYKPMKNCFMVRSLVKNYLLIYFSVFIVLTDLLFLLCHCYFFRTLDLKQIFV